MLPHTEQSEREETFAIALVLLFFVFLIFLFPFFTTWPEGAVVYQDDCGTGTVVQGTKVDTEEEKVDITISARPSAASSSSSQTQPLLACKQSTRSMTPSQRDRQRLTPIENVKIFPAYGPGFSMPVHRS